MTVGSLGRRRIAWSDIMRHAAAHALLLAGAVTMVVPFLWMISSSLKSEMEIFLFPPVWIPSPPRWDNYPRTLAAVPFLQFTWNSLYISALNAVGQVLTCSMAAYAFARFTFPGRDMLFLVLLATLMVPFQVTMIPVWLIMRELGWINTHLPLIVPAFLGGAFGTFLLRQFFMTLPTELEDAARIDGCGRWGIYWRIFMPLSKPALATLAVFVFMGRWNDLLGPVIYLTSPEKMTLSVGLAYLRGQYTTQWALLMAGSLLSVLPMLALFAVAQQYFVRGVVLSGIKG